MTKIDFSGTGFLASRYGIMLCQSFLLWPNNPWRNSQSSNNEIILLTEKQLTHLPSAAYMRHWAEPALVQVMACRLFGAEPLPEPVLAYCKWDPYEQISVKFESEFYHFDSRKCILMSSAKIAAILTWRDELMHRTQWGLEELMSSYLTKSCGQEIEWYDLPIVQKLTNIANKHGSDTNRLHYVYFKSSSHFVLLNVGCIFLITFF